MGAILRVASGAGQRVNSRHMSLGKQSPRSGLARALSKRGYCSRTAAAALISAGRVQLNGKITRDPEAPTTPASRIEVDGFAVAAVDFVYLALNKPRGLVTTATDEQDRATVYTCLEGAPLPWVSPVGRLDKASEGLLLMSNDTVWAAGITEPVHGLTKTYHVQVSPIPDAARLQAMEAGCVLPDGERLHAVKVILLRHGERNAWLECTLDEGRNRHLRRLCEAFDLEVLRLVRVAIGPLTLGPLAKGAWRHLSAAEVDALRPAAR